MNEGVLSFEFGFVGWLVVVEEVIIVWDVLFVYYVGVWLYVCYLLTVGSVEVICWVKVCGIWVIVEVMLYYLLFDE